MSSNCFKITNIKVKTETLQTLSDKNYGKICYSDNSFLCPALSLPALTMSWKEDRHLHHTSSWVQKNAVKIDQHLHHTFCSVHSNAVKKKTETCITPFDVFTIVLWKRPNFKSHFFICSQSCCQKKIDTCITLFLMCSQHNVLKRGATLPSNLLLCSQQGSV